jgi:RNA polymerase sigma-70 factor (ECF subfamily)
VSAPTSESLIDITGLPLEALSGAPDDVEASVLALFDRSAPSLLRYAASFGLNADETEDIVQDAFLALFRHLHLGRARTNLTGWLFQVTHNLALKRRQQTIRLARTRSAGEIPFESRHDPALNPEERLLRDERRRRLRAVFNALPDRERRCLFLRAEGLTYRDIAKALSVSLGSVSKALTRAVSRLMHADGG